MLRKLLLVAAAAASLGAAAMAPTSASAHSRAFHQAPHAANSHGLAAVPRAARGGSRRVTRARPGDVGHAHP